MLRVEALDGALLQVVRERAGRRAGRCRSCARTVLVASRPAPWASGTDAPMHQDYHWVAMLDPAELADVRRRRSLAEVASTTAGRPGRRSSRRRPSYEPRCGCCPLLRTRRIDLLEYEDRPEHVLAAYPDAFRVRLDVGTGVCVLTEEIGGPTPGKGHDLRIEAVDEAMDDGPVPPSRLQSPAQ